MRVALVTPGYTPDVGGIETHVERLAAGFVARGHEAVVFTHGKAETTAFLDGVRVRRFRVLRDTNHLAFAPGLWTALRRDARSFDVVHAHGYHALPAFAAALAGGAPLVFTPHFHGGGHSRFRAALHVLYRPAGRHIFRSAAAVICVSTPECDLVRRRVPGVEDRLTVIPNGVDAETIRNATPFPVRHPMLLSVGRLEAYKRFDRSLDALTALPDDWTLTIVGTGERSRALRHRANHLRIENRVRMTGEVERGELHRFYRTATAYLTMSTREAFGMTVLEATAAGAAVVASDIPAHRYVRGLAGAGDRFVLVDNEAGAEQIAAALLGATGAPAKASPMLPTWDEAVDATLAQYERLVGAHP